MNKNNQLKNANGGLMKLRWFALALLLLTVSGTAHAKQEPKPEFRFARILSDGMVLQQEKPIKIWGWAKPDTQVSVTLTQEEAKKLALDRKLRQLQIDLPKLEADLYKGDAKKQLESKLARIEAILDELQKDPWLSKKLDPTAIEKVKAMRNALHHHETRE